MKSPLMTRAGLQARFATNASEDNDKFIFYVRMRQYKSLKSGFIVADAAPTYKPFQLKCHTKDVLIKRELDKDHAADDNESVASKNVQTLCFIVIATPILSAHTCE